MMIIFKISLLILLINSAYAGFLHSPLDYGEEYAAPVYLPYDVPHHGQFAAPLPVDGGDSLASYPNPLPVAPLPVAPVSVNTYASSTSHHTYAAPSPPPFVKYQLGFRTFKPKFRLASASFIPSAYNGPLPYGISPPHLAYNGLGGHNAVIKYGPPITTTTTTYSTAASGGVIPFASPFAAQFTGRIGW